MLSQKLWMTLCLKQAPCEKVTNCVTIYSPSCCFKAFWLSSRHFKESTSLYFECNYNEWEMNLWRFKNCLKKYIIKAGIHYMTLPQFTAWRVNASCRKTVWSFELIDFTENCITYDKHELLLFASDYDSVQLEDIKHAWHFLFVRGLTWHISVWGPI